MLNERIMREMKAKYFTLENIIKSPVEALFFKQFTSSTKIDYLGGIKDRFIKYANSPKGSHYYYSLIITERIKTLKPTKDNVARMKTAAFLLENG